MNPNLDEAANGLPILIGKVEAADGDRGDVVMLTLRGADARFCRAPQNYIKCSFHRLILIEISAYFI